MGAEEHDGVIYVYTSGKGYQVHDKDPEPIQEPDWLHTDD